MRPDGGRESRGPKRRPSASRRMVGEPGRGRARFFPRKKPPSKYRQVSGCSSSSEYRSFRDSARIRIDRLAATAVLCVRTEDERAVGRSAGHRRPGAWLVNPGEAAPGSSPEKNPRRNTVRYRDEAGRRIRQRRRRGRASAGRRWRGVVAGVRDRKVSRRVPR